MCIYGCILWWLFGSPKVLQSKNKVLYSDKIFTLILTPILTLSYPFSTPDPDPDPDPNPNSNPNLNPDPKPNPNSVGLVNPF